MYRKPTILVFAGPNGSGKSTATNAIDVVGKYINADEIQRSLNLNPYEAAVEATKQREECITQLEEFTFETVASTDRNLELLIRAKQSGYFIKIIYVITVDSAINVARVKERVMSGGHDVPKDKIVIRYKRALKLLPKFVEVADVFHMYDNSSTTLVRIFRKRKDLACCFYNDIWETSAIRKLVSLPELDAVDFDYIFNCMPDYLRESCTNKVKAVMDFLDEHPDLLNKGDYSDVQNGELKK